MTAGATTTGTATLPETPLTYEAARQKQLERLREEIVRWRAQIPYYKDLLLADVELRSLADLQKLPVLTRQNVRQGVATLVAPPEVVGDDLAWASTSGTTDDRLAFAHYIKDSVPIIRRLYDSLDASVRIPWSERRVAALVTPICSGTECHRDMSVEFEARVNANNYLKLNSVSAPVRVSDQTLAIYVEEINRHRANAFNCTASYAAPLARYILRERPTLPKIRFIGLTAEVPSLFHRKVIERAFEAPSFDFYAATEFIGPGGVECKAGRMHVPYDFAIIELLDRDKKPVAHGEVGRIHFTSLRRTSMPLLRYAMTDLARAYDGPCPCGSPEPSMGVIEGRAGDVIGRTDGSPVTPREIDRALFAAVPYGIGWYAVVQSAERAYKLVYVAADDWDAEVEKKAVAALSDLLGAGADVRVSKTVEIRPSASGKFRLCYQEPMIKNFVEVHY